MRLPNKECIISEMGDAKNEGKDKAKSKGPLITLHTTCPECSWSNVTFHVRWEDDTYITCKDCGEKYFRSDDLGAQSKPDLLGWPDGT